MSEMDELRNQIEKIDASSTAVKSTIPKHIDNK